LSNRLWRAVKAGYRLNPAWIVGATVRLLNSFCRNWKRRARSRPRHQSLPRSGPYFFAGTSRARRRAGSQSLLYRQTARDSIHHRLHFTHREAGDQFLGLGERTPAQVSRVYLAAARRYILRQTRRFTVTTTIAITIVEASSSAKLPESVAREMVAPKPTVV
jgi:hypothetical protein